MKTGDQQDSGSEKNQESTPINQEVMAYIKKLEQKIDELQNNRASSSVDQLASALRSASGKNAEIDYSNGIEADQIPVDDFDKEGVLFCAPYSGYVIVDDKRQGHVVKLPYNKKSIVFSFQGERRHQRGKYQELSVFSSYISHSKKEQEWLRNHSLYNVAFYENTNLALNSNSLRAQKMSRVMSVLKAYTTPDILKRCEEHNVPKSNDLNLMRYNLAEKMIDREIEMEKEMTRKIVEDTQKSTVLLGSK